MNTQTFISLTFLLLIAFITVVTGFNLTELIKSKPTKKDVDYICSNGLFKLVKKKKCGIDGYVIYKAEITTTENSNISFNWSPYILKNVNSVYLDEFGISKDDLYPVENNGGIMKIYNIAHYGHCTVSVVSHMFEIVDSLNNNIKNSDEYKKFFSILFSNK